MHSFVVISHAPAWIAARRFAVLLAAAVALLAGALSPSAAFAQDDPGPDNPPIVTGGTVTPSSLGWEGGQVDITANVIDDYGLSMVYATLYGPDSTPYPV